MRFVPSAIICGVLGCAAALLVACGDRSSLLSGNDAANLQDALASVQAACAAGQTADAAVAARRFSDRVAELSPREVDTRLIDNLSQGASTLDALVSRTCTAEEPETTPTTTTAPTTTETTTTPTVPTQTTTVPTTPTTTTPPPETTPEVPPSNDDDPGPGNGNGNGPPGGVPPGQVEQNGGAGDEQ